MSTGNRDIILKIEPITRIEGHLGLFVKANSEGKTQDAYTIAILFRGFEIILKGRRPDSAIFTSSRSCGVCGAAHASASVLACDMALGVAPTPLAAALRNLAYAMTDYTYDHTVLLNLLEGPDYSEYILKYTCPKLLEASKSYSCSLADYHGYRTIYDMECGWNPIPKPGLTYVLSVYYQRLAKEAGSLIFGKFAHPATLVPGGVCFDIKYMPKLFTYYMERLIYLTLWVKWLIAQWIDMLKFYYDHVEVKQTGETYARCQGLTYDPPIMLSAGLFEDPLCDLYTNDKDITSYVDIYLEVDDAYSRRMHKPGFAIGDKIVYNNFTDMQRNMVELITSAYYWHKPELMGKYVTEWDPAGKPIAGGVYELVPFHEWNKETLPHPGPLPNIPEEWSGQPYSWCTEPRMVVENERMLVPFEAGPIAKLWVDAIKSEDLEKTFSKAFTELGISSHGMSIRSGLSGSFPIRPKISVKQGFTLTLPGFNDIKELAKDIIEIAKKYLEYANIPTDGISTTFIDELKPPPGIGTIRTLLEEPLTIWWWNEHSTTLFRLYARAVSLVMAIMGAWWTFARLLKYYEEALYRGVGAKWMRRPGRPWKYPTYPMDALGVGWLEAPRGAVRHWIVVKDGKIANYQYHAPTTGNATPRTQMKIVWDVFKANVKAPEHIKTAYVNGCLIGPYEAAALNTYVTEELPPDQWTGLDYVRALRSFDPCIGCAVHLELAGRRLRKYISPVAWSP